MNESLSIIQLAAIVAGYALAVSRLMDAARPLWHWAPQWLQLALPALVTALPEFAAALGLVKTKTDLMQAIVIALGTVTTAMRGALPKKVFDQLPYEAKMDLKAAREGKGKPPSGGSGGVTELDSSVLQSDAPPPRGVMKLTWHVWCCLLLTGCGLFGGADYPKEEPPCDDASYAKLSVSCGNDEAECNRQIEEREAFCAKRMQGESK